MALDEYLFGKIAQLVKARRSSTPGTQDSAVRLEDLKPRLTVLACALSGQSIDIYPAEEEGGYKNNSFFLPAACTLFPDAGQNRSFYFFRTLYLSVQHKMELNWTDDGEKNLSLSRQKARETAPAVLKTLFEEFPRAEDWYNEFVSLLNAQTPPGKESDYTPLYGKWMRNEPETAKQHDLYAGNTPSDARPTPATVLKAKIVEEIVRLEVDKKAQEDYVLTHNFEKVETADEFSGVWRDFDGDDDLESHQEALDELRMKYTVRVNDPVHSIYQADFLENTTVSESAGISTDMPSIPYDEWNYAKRAYRPGFCRLFPQKAVEKNAGYCQQTLSEHGTILRGLRKMLTNLDNKLQQQRRQSQGDSFDIDSVTDLYVDTHSGHTPSEKIYLSKRKKEKDISILLLLDISLSTDGYADGNRIIDVEKQAAILFGTVLDEYEIDFSIHCFYSQTRNFANYLTVKDFDENWESARFKIGAVQPCGYTRIGTALRHSGALLDARPSRNKWLVLISDGKPNDYDKYEGKYGVQDVKQALRELNSRQINAFALAIEATAKQYLPQMFGVNDYQIMSSPQGLLTGLVSLYERIKYQS